MVTQTVTVGKNNTQNIIIGRRGTYLTEEVVFDCTWFAENYGNGTAALLIRRPKDTDAYPKVVSQDGNIVTWTVDNVDTSFKGHGECELFWYVDGGLTKSVIWDVTILRDIGDSSETPPDPYRSWVEAVIEAKIDAEKAAIRAEEAGGAATIGTAALTERVETGTKILNPVWANRICAQLGYAYFNNKVYIYSVFGSGTFECDHFASKVLYEYNSENDPYEFTIENAPHSITADTNTEIYKYRASYNVSVNPFHVDVRLARIFYDAENNVIAVDYSAQYRYSVTDGVASRAIVQTTPQSGNLTIDVGLLSSGNSSVYRTFNDIQQESRSFALLPLVSTEEPAQYSFIVPDSMFENQPNGLRMAVVMGDRKVYRGPTVYKSEVTT